MQRRWAILMTSVLAASTISACGGEEPNKWVIGLDAGSDATRAEIRIENGDDIRTFEADLPWNEEIEMPNGSYSITLTVRSLDGNDVGCGIDGPHDPGKGVSQMNRESQGGGTAVECRMSGSISSGEYSFEANSDILEEGTDGGVIDDTAPETSPPDTAAAPETTEVPEPTTTEPTPPSTTTGTDFSPRMVYENGVLSVLLDDLHDDSQVTLSLAVGENLEFVTKQLGLPDYLITSAQLPNATINFDLSPTFGDELAEIVPEAPEGYAIDVDISKGAMVGAVQQPNGAADENRLYGTVVLGDWKAQLVVYVNSAALDAGTITMDQVAALLTTIMQSFTVTPA